MEQYKTVQNFDNEILSFIYNKSLDERTMWVKPAIQVYDVNINVMKPTNKLIKRAIIKAKINLYVVSLHHKNIKRSCKVEA